MSGPVEGLLREQQLEKSPADLGREGEREGGFIRVVTLLNKLENCFVNNFLELWCFKCEQLCVQTSVLTGKSTTGTVRVTATSTARRTHRISVSNGSTEL